MLQTLKKLARAVLPRRLSTQVYRYAKMPLYGRVRFGSLDRLTPIELGVSSGRRTYIDRYYQVPDLLHAVKPQELVSSGDNARRSTARES
ncbi:MAG TPA: hypothetical protein VG225_06790 [Terracidiphilus sp.]|jgi:hypothetical protein|nr:hypothetical protein [Terracidiphilus sp.]